MTIKTGFIAILTLWMSSAWAVTTEIVQPHPQLTVGDVVQFVIKPDKDTDALPEFAADLQQGPVKWGDARILWFKPFDPQTGQMTLGVTSYKPSSVEVKAIPFKRGDQVIFSTESKTLQFTPIPGEDSDIFPPQPVGYPFWLLIALGLGGSILAGVAAWLIYRYWWKKQRAEIVKGPPPVILTPIERLEKEIHAVESCLFLAKGHYKPHYFGISEAVKRFLGSNYKFDAQECTTRELLNHLESQQLDAALLKNWKELFEEMDLIKFTDQKPVHAEAQSLGSRCRQAAEGSK